MRPLRLEMTGFAAFREPTIVQFEGHELLAFTGPTGAGKSSIIDGIAFALFGSVARYGNEKLIAPIINTMSTEARVRLDFGLGDERYTAVRVIRKTANGASTKEARLERADIAGETAVLAGTAAEVTTEVESLLGLNFAQFTKTIVLPQGDFARFLTETAGDRQTLLRRLLGLDIYASMGATARRRAKEARIQADATRAALGNVEIVTDAALARLTKAATKLDTATIAAGETHSQLANALEAQHGTAEALSRISEALALLERVSIPDDALAYGGDVSAADKDIAKAEKHAQLADQKMSAAREALDALTSADEIESGLALRDRADELTASVAALDATAKTEAATFAEATKTVTSIEERLAHARDELEHTRIAAGAAGIAATLSIGDDCPVCTQVIGELPETHDHDVGQLESLVTQVEDAARAARNAAQETNKRATTAQVAAANERAALDAANEQITNLPTRSQLTAMSKKATAASARLDAATESAHAAANALAEALERRSALDERSTALSRDFVEARDRLAFLDPPVPSHGNVIDNWEELAEWSSTHASALSLDRKELEAQAHANNKAVATSEKAMVKHAKPFDHLDGIDLANLNPIDMYDALTHERDAATSRRDDAAFRQARDSANAIRITELEDESIVSAEIGKLLNAKGFEQWLMADVMADLAERASERLRVLSSSAYSLTTDGTDFSVLDHRNADEVRSARTLSGGETFLASLALALALADSITDMASASIPPTESVFLDEGFGTLDGETLDVVATAIEELGAAGRLVCVVTHITELADRLPQHVRVTRSPTGSTVSQGNALLEAPR